MICVVFFFFKQKTAYEMRISDWSSDVCSSDLAMIVDHEAAIGEPPVVAPERERAEMHPYTMPRRRLAHRGEHAIVGLGRDPRRTARAITIEQPGHFGGEHRRRPLAARALDRVDDRDRKSTRLNSRH